MLFLVLFLSDCCRNQHFKKFLNACNSRNKGSEACFKSEHTNSGLTWKKDSHVICTSWKPAHTVLNYKYMQFTDKFSNEKWNIVVSQIKKCMNTSWLHEMCLFKSPLLPSLLFQYVQTETPHRGWLVPRICSFKLEPYDTKKFKVSLFCCCFLRESLIRLVKSSVY